MKVIYKITWNHIFKTVIENVIVYFEGYIAHSSYYIKNEKKLLQLLINL